jgi:hypothetical protein
MADLCLTRRWTPTLRAGQLYVKHIDQRQYGSDRTLTIVLRYRSHMSAIGFRFLGRRYNAGRVENDRRFDDDVSRLSDKFACF